MGFCGRLRAGSGAVPSGTVCFFDYDASRNRSSLAVLPGLDPAWHLNSLLISQRTAILFVQA
jgi:hypothetical protein